MKLWKPALSKLSFHLFLKLLRIIFTLGWTLDFRQTFIYSLQYTRRDRSREYTLQTLLTSWKAKQPSTGRQQGNRKCNYDCILFQRFCGYTSSSSIFRQYLQFLTVSVTYYVTKQLCSPSFQVLSPKRRSWPVNKKSLCPKRCIIHNTITKHPTTPQMCRYTTLSSVLKATTENRTTSEVKHPTLIVIKFFINMQNFWKTLTKCEWHQCWRD